MALHAGPGGVLARPEKSARLGHATTYAGTVFDIIKRKSSFLSFMTYITIFYY